MRLINYPKVKCVAGERFIKWSQSRVQRGPAGATGAQGPKGDQGPAGTSGSSNWGDIADKPDALADGQIGWGEVVNKPADVADGQLGWDNVTNKPVGFADNVDNVTGITLTRKVGSQKQIPVRGETSSWVDCPMGSMVTGGGAYTQSLYDSITSSYPVDADTWEVWVYNDSDTLQTFTAYAICMSTDPSSAIVTAKKGVLPASVKKDMKKRGR